MFIKNFVKNDNIIYENTAKISKRFKNNIDLTLYIRKRIFIFYKNYARFFLFSIINNNKFSSIEFLNVELIKLYYIINCDNVNVIDYKNNNI